MKTTPQLFHRLNADLVVAVLSRLMSAEAVAAADALGTRRLSTSRLAGLCPLQRPYSSRAVSGDLGYTSGFGLHTPDAGREPEGSC